MFSSTAVVALIAIEYLIAKSVYADNQKNGQFRRPQQSTDRTKFVLSHSFTKTTPVHQKSLETTYCSYTDVESELRKDINNPDSPDYD